MFDSHCHLNFSEFDNRLNDELNQCKALNINHWMIPGVKLDSIHQFQNLLLTSANQFNLYFCLGLHPYFIEQHSIESLVDFEKQIHDFTFHGIGETGLDASCTNHTLQIKLLRRHFELAKHSNLPIILHHRKTQPELLKMAKQYPTVKGVIHAFSGSYEQAKQWVDLGYYLGVGGVITYERAVKTKNAISKIDLSHLLLETDAPSMPIFLKQGEINSPSNLHIIAQNLALLKQTELLIIDQVTTQNAMQLFGKL
ncbi:TatD family hydrolase [Marinicellulosiphila megalodicopiae]|uniref:TatD family hydrolase n=1 Tax=Marinicellulosiphila megalodicopiae TaxID=2724896 RepID=UPI003BAF7CD3